MLTIIEEKGNLFTISEEYIKMQCISSDFECGLGIAMEFNRYYNIHNVLKSDNYKHNKGVYPNLVYANSVINLVTKNKYYNKPTYINFACAVERLASFMYTKSIDKIASHRLGCHLDKLDWLKVKHILHIYLDILPFDVDLLIREI